MSIDITTWPYHMAKHQVILTQNTFCVIQCTDNSSRRKKPTADYDELLPTDCCSSAVGDISAGLSHWQLP